MQTRHSYRQGRAIVTTLESIGQWRHSVMYADPRGGAVGNAGGGLTGISKGVYSRRALIINLFAPTQFPRKANEAKRSLLFASSALLKLRAPEGFQRKHDHKPQSHKTTYPRSIIHETLPYQDEGSSLTPVPSLASYPVTAMWRTGGCPSHLAPSRSANGPSERAV